jgi:uncharacterized membrane protein
MKKILVPLFLLIFLNTVSAATIHGSVYDISLNLVQNAVLEVSSQPKQYFVAKNGTYSFDLNPGKYQIKASYSKGNTIEAIASENISIMDDGSYVLDFILFPSFSDESELISEEIASEESDETTPKNYMGFVMVGLALGIGLIILTAKKLWGKSAKKPVYEEDSLNQLVSIIKAKGGRTTQKEIRKELPLSEAKISLMLTELEDKGIIKKIKKGRGNIILLNKK